MAQVTPSPLVGEGQTPKAAGDGGMTLATMTKKPFGLVMTLTLSVLLLCATGSNADAGLTMPALVEAALSMGYMLALIPFVFVVFIESIFFTAYLKIRFYKTLWPTAVANFVSTLFGVPLYMFVRVLHFKVAGQEHLVSLVPAYFLSVLVEYMLLLTFFTSIDRPKLKKAVYLANAVSYLFLAIWVLGLDRGWNLPILLPGQTLFVH